MRNESEFTGRPTGDRLNEMPDWDVPPTPATEIMQRWVFANMRPVGAPAPAGKMASGDPAFDKFLAGVTAGSSR